MYPSPLLWFLRGPVQLNNKTLLSCHNDGKGTPPSRFLGAGFLCVFVQWQAQPGCCLGPCKAEMPFACWESCTWSHSRVWGTGIAANYQCWGLLVWEVMSWRTFRVLFWGSILILTGHKQNRNASCKMNTGLFPSVVPVQWALGMKKKGF